MRKLALPALVLLSLLLCPPLLLAQESGEAPVTIRILHTNDVHGQVRPTPATWKRDQDPPPLAGGYVTLAEAVEEERKAGPNLLVDAGDWFQGTPEGVFTRGTLMIDLMSALRYDAAVVGNHDFDLGEGLLEELSKRAKFPVLGANILEKDGTTSRPYVKAAVVVERAGVKIGLIGVVTESSPEIISSRLARELTIGEEAEGLARGVLEAKKGGAEIVVAVNHVGAAENYRHAAEIPGIDVIIGGHNHGSILKNGKVIEPTGTLVAQAASRGTALGIVEVDFDRRSRRVTAKRARLREIWFDPVARHEACEALIAAGAGAVGKDLDRPIATAARTLKRADSPGQPSPLGNWVADVMRERAGAEVAIHNRTGIRKDLSQGPVSKRDLFEVCPFDNRLVTVKLTGSALKRVMEHALERSSRALEVSGAEVVLDPDAGAGARVKSLKVKGTEVDDTALVLVVTNSFIGEGGDGYKMFAEGKDFTDTGILLRDALIDAAAAQRSVAGMDEVRWRFVPREGKGKD
jgi:2',3'-cyclic-nucleotide 2'-phosphodiesterase (5'-nucleotidase family)